LDDNPDFIQDLIYPKIKASNYNQVKFLESIEKLKTKSYSQWTIEVCPSFSSLDPEDAQPFSCYMKKHVRTLRLCKDDTLALKQAFNYIDSYRGVRADWENPNTYPENEKEEEKTAKNQKTIAQFIYQEMVDYYKDRMKKATASLVDGLNQLQRHIISYCLNDDQVKYTKTCVSSLSGAISKKIGHKGSLSSIDSTIQTLAKKYPNHLNYFHLYGLINSESRYQTVILNQIIPLLFPEQDDSNPNYLIPILPLILLNGNKILGSVICSGYPDLGLMNILSWMKKMLSLPGNFLIPSPIPEKK